MEKRSKAEIELVKRIIEVMEKGNLAWKELWNSDFVRPQNPISGTKYSGTNRLNFNAIAIEKEYTDPRFITFNQAKEAGYIMKKGSKGIPCVFFKAEKIEKEKTEEKTEEKIKIIRQQYTVFNAECFLNMPQFEIKKRDKSETLKNLIASSEVKIKELAQEKAFYNRTTDEITMPLFNSFISDDNAISTLLHEMIHATGSSNRLNREKGGAFGDDKYAREELIAELGSMFVKQDLGIDLSLEQLENSSAYLQSWLNTLKKEPQELFAIIKESSKASERIVENYNNYVELAQKNSSNIKVDKNKYILEKYEDGNIKRIVEQIDNLYIRMINYYNSGNVSLEENMKKSSSDKIGITMSSVLHGISKSFYENGQIENEWLYKNGSREGMSKGYYETGILAYEENYKNNELDGYSRHYHKNGKLWLETFYKNGNQDGICKSYDEKGQLKYEIIYENQNKNYKKYDENQNIKEEIQYSYSENLKNYLKNGYEKLYDKGIIQEEKKYKMNTLLELIKYSENRKDSIFYENNIPQKKIEREYNNNELKKEIIYKRDDFEGWKIEKTKEKQRLTRADLRKKGRECNER